MFYYLKNFSFFLSALRANHKGVTTIEYGILAAGVAIIIGALVSTDGLFYQTLESLFENIVNQLPQAGKNT